MVEVYLLLFRSSCWPDNGGGYIINFELLNLISFSPTRVNYNILSIHVFRVHRHRRRDFMVLTTGAIRVEMYLTRG